MAIFLPADITKPMYEIHPKHGATFAQEELCELLECERVEYTETSDGQHLLVGDEEAKLAPTHKRNHRAGEYIVFQTLGEVKAQLEKMQRRGISVMHNYDFSRPLDEPADYIAGDVLICEPWEVA